MMRPFFKRNLKQVCALLARWNFVALLALVIFIACSRNEPVAENPLKPSGNALQLVTSYALSVTEPSGLAYSKFSRTLYLISDNRSEIFKIDTTGRVLSRALTLIGESKTKLIGVVLNSVMMQDATSYNKYYKKYYSKKSNPKKS